MSAPGDDDTSPTGSAQTTVVSQPTFAAPAGSRNALPPGCRLGEFELTGVIGQGGFGIVYLAYDHSLQRRVALKEYMPASLAQRTGVEVSVKAEGVRGTFTAGLRSFVNEARLLAQFDHPALVKVYRFWEANGTAYMAMPFYQGVTLRQRLRDMGAPPDEAWLKRLLAPLMDVLEVLHRERCYHRDIAPDNILLLEDGRPLLLDFGAARRVIGDMTHALTVILKPGYAPIEQYAEVPGMKQGAFTDVYALAAVLYSAILKQKPPSAVGRMVNDTMAPAARAAAGRYSDAFLRGIDRSLAVKPEDRPQSVGEMRALLGIDAPLRASARAPAHAAEATSAAGAPATERAPGPKVPRVAIVTGIAALVVAAVAGGAWLMAPSRNAATPASQAAAAVPVAAPTQSAAPQPPFSPVAALDEIFQQRDREHTVSFALDRAQVRIHHDKLTFRLRSSRPGYLYVFMVGTDRRHFHLLFPNAVDADNRVEAGKELALPRPGWSMVAAGPPGTNHFVAVVSASPRDFSATGLQRLDPFAEFPLARAEQTWLARRGESSPFLGTPVCPPGAPGCPQSYGAAIFTIDEVN